MKNKRQIDFFKGKLKKNINHQIDFLMENKKIKKEKKKNTTTIRYI